MSEGYDQIGEDQESKDQHQLKNEAEDPGYGEHRAKGVKRSEDDALDGQGPLPIPPPPFSPSGNTSSAAGYQKEGQREPSPNYINPFQGQ